MRPKKVCVHGLSFWLSVRISNFPKGKLFLVLLVVVWAGGLVWVGGSARSPSPPLPAAWFSKSLLTAHWTILAVDHEE